jgi:hypothetical protein
MAALAIPITGQEQSLSESSVILQVKFGVLGHSRKVSCSQGRGLKRNFADLRKTMKSLGALLIFGCDPRPSACICGQLMNRTNPRKFAGRTQNLSHGWTRIRSTRASMTEPEIRRQHVRAETLPSHGASCATRGRCRAPRVMSPRAGADRPTRDGQREFGPALADFSGPAAGHLGSVFPGNPPVSRSAHIP